MGLATILGGATGLDFGGLAQGEVSTLAPILAGIGLLLSRDNTVSSEDAGVK